MAVTQPSVEPEVPTEVAQKRTAILPVDAAKIGKLQVKGTGVASLEDWDIEWDLDSPDFQRLQEAAEALKSSDIPVGFPTETVYGLGADATRSNAVRGIFEAKRRPADNPLIVHIHSLKQLRGLLRKSSASVTATPIINDHSKADDDNLVPRIYLPLIERFWPGPLTILLPNPQHSPLAPEVTAGLPTFGARMPRNILALALMKLSSVPMAGPSANASTRPSPTTAEHVLEDMSGRINYIIDGGPCDVGVESTVVDGLCSPPVILRPGGVTIEELRSVPGWEDVQIGYKNIAEMGDKAPRAPGMKYRHYSPKASVVLYEAGAKQPDIEELKDLVSTGGALGIIRTQNWKSIVPAGETHVTNGQQDQQDTNSLSSRLSNGHHQSISETNGQQQQQQQHHTPASESNLSTALENLLLSIPSTFTTLTTILPATASPSPSLLPQQHQQQEPTKQHQDQSQPITIHEIHIGTTPHSIARGIFSALRLLDSHNVDRIVVEGIDDSVSEDGTNNGALAAAIMNRVRKAADKRVNATGGLKPAF